MWIDPNAHVQALLGVSARQRLWHVFTSSVCEHCQFPWMNNNCFQHLETSFLKLVLTQPLSWNDWLDSDQAWSSDFCPTSTDSTEQGCRTCRASATKSGTLYPRRFSCQGWQSDPVAICGHLWSLDPRSRPNATCPRHFLMPGLLLCSPGGDQDICHFWRPTQVWSKIMQE